jgi:hypothetical protein
LTKGIRTSAPKGELDEKGVEKKNDLVYYLFKLTNYLSHFFLFENIIPGWRSFDWFGSDFAVNCRKCAV